MSDGLSEGGNMGSPIKVGVDRYRKASGWLATLNTISQFSLSRGKGCWTAPGAPEVSNRMVLQLVKEGLISRRWVSGMTRLELTDSGELLVRLMTSESDIKRKFLK
jgi:hypothetical protein